MDEILPAILLWISERYPAEYGPPGDDGAGSWTVKFKHTDLVLCYSSQDQCCQLITTTGAVAWDYVQSPRWELADPSLTDRLGEFLDRVRWNRAPHPFHTPGR